MADLDNYIPNKSGSDIYTELMWDNQKEVINANRVKRFTLIYTEGKISYNGTSTVTWSANIYIWHLDNIDGMIYNQIASGNISCNDYDVLYVNLSDINATTLPMKKVDYAAFDRAGIDPANESGDVLIIGLTTSTDFSPIGWIPKVMNLYGNIGINTNDVEAWNSNFNAIEFPRSAIMYHKTNGSFYILSNAYFSDDYRRKTGSGNVFNMGITDSLVLFRVAGSGAIDSVITWINALRLNTSGGVQFKAGAVVDDIDITIEASPTDAQLLTALAIKNYIATLDHHSIYQHPSDAGNKHIPINGASNQFLKYSASGTVVWAVPSYYTHPDTAGNKHIPSSGATGNFLKYDGTSGVAAWVTPSYYSHPSTAGNKHVPSGGSTGQFLKYGGSSGLASWLAHGLSYGDVGAASSGHGHGFGVRFAWYNLTGTTSGSFSGGLTTQTITVYTPATGQGGRKVSNFSVPVVNNGSPGSGFNLYHGFDGGSTPTVGCASWNGSGSHTFTCSHNAHQSLGTGTSGKLKYRLTAPHTNFTAGAETQATIYKGYLVT